MFTTVRVLRLAPGIALALAIAGVATALGRAVPLIGAPVIAILLGILLHRRCGPDALLGAGIAFSGRSLLQSAIVISGLAVSFETVLRTGIATLPLTLVTVAVALVLMPLVARLLQLERSLSTLIGVGTAICGASAIAAVAPVLESTEAETALAIATIFFYNIVAVLVFPPLGHLMQMTQTAFGTWAGTAINDTSSVVAAGFAYGREAATQATIVKLTRATLILPLVAAIAAARMRWAPAHRGPIAWRRIVPWFIVWFLVAAVVNGLGAIPAAWHGPIGALSGFLIAAALAAIGLQTEMRHILRTGLRPLALGLVLWIAVAVASLLVQRAVG